MKCKICGQELANGAKFCIGCGAKIEVAPTPQAAPQKIAAKPVVNPAPQPVAQPAVKPAPQPVAQPAVKPAPQPVAQPAVKPAPQPVAQPVAQPAVKPAPQPVAQPAVKPAPQPVAQPVVNPAPQPVAQPVAQPATQPVPTPMPMPMADGQSMRRTRKEYKVLTQKDKWFSGKFDPMILEQALNSYAQQGWRVVTAVTAEIPGWFSNTREECIVILEREV